MNIRKIIITVVLGTLLLASMASAQGELSQTTLKQINTGFFADHAIFESEIDTLARVEVYYKIYHSTLEFAKSKENWQARSKLSINVTGNNDFVSQVQNREGTVTVKSKARTNSPRDFRSGQANFDLPKGKYKIKLTLQDIKSHKVTNKDFKIKIKNPNIDNPRMSDVEFAESVIELNSGSVMFQKGNLAIVPAVSRMFGGLPESKLLYYLEIYQGNDSGVTVVVETKLRHRRKGMVYRDTLHTALDIPVVRQLRQIALVDMPGGMYEMEIILRGRRNKGLANRKIEFEILQTVESMIRTEWKMLLRQLSYIAEPGEIKKMKKFEEFEQRKQAIVEFWRRRDPTVGSRGNEARQAFNYRVHVVNKLFTYSRQSGWETDRGRIYIIHGEPDKIDEHPYALSSAPFTIWHYYINGRYRRFTFVDDLGDGDYRLIFLYDGLGQTPDF